MILIGDVVVLVIYIFFFKG